MLKKRAMTNYPFLFSIAHNQKHIKTLKARIKLIKKVNLYDIDELVQIIREPKKSENLISQLIKHCKSDDVILDEYEKAILFYCWYVSRRNMTTDDVIRYSHFIQCFMLLDHEISREKFIQKNSNLIDSERDVMLRWVEGYRKIEFPKMRGKIALIEIAAMFDPDHFIPVLLNYSLEYLKSNFTISWIKKNRRELFENKNQGKSLNTKKKLLQAIWGSKNLKARLHDYWRIHVHYEKLASTILNLRNNGKTLRNSELELTFKVSGIPKNYRTLTLDKKIPVKNLALEIMVVNKLIKDVKSFKEFQSYINKLHKKHFGANMASLEHEFMPYLFRFLDIPSKIPQNIRYLDIYDQLQYIEMT